MWPVIAGCGYRWGMGILSQAPVGTGKRIMHVVNGQLLSELYEVLMQVFNSVLPDCYLCRHFLSYNHADL